VDVRQRGATTTTLDADATLDDLPAWVPRRAGIDADTDAARRVAHA
jgi:hypothetical protein